MRVALVAFDGFTDLDVFLPWDLLHRVRAPGWEVTLVGSSSVHVSKHGLPVPMGGPLEDAGRADAVLFASGPATRTLMRDEAWLSRLRGALAPERQLVGAMCSGALLLGALGLLRGKRATTYPTAKEALAAFGVEVVDRPFVQEGNVATAARCLAGVALSAWVVEALVGKEARDAMLEEVQPVGG